VKKLLLVLAVVLMASVARAQTTAPVRYHFGDDPDGKLGWADPDFDDSAWPVAENGRVPQPPFQSNGFFWVRARASVPPGLADSLDVQSLDALHGPGVQAIFVNGVSVGHSGRFPPDDVPILAPRMLTFSAPAGVVQVAQPGTTALVAVRGWSPPHSRVSGGPLHFAFAIDRHPALQTAERADFDSALLATLPPVIFNLLFFLLGFGLLIFFGRVASRELLFEGLWLLTVPLYLILISFQRAGTVPDAVSARAWFLVYCVIVAPGFWAQTEFFCTVYQLRGRFLRILLHASWICYVLALMPPALAHHQASWIPPLLSISSGALTLFNALCLGVNLWAIFVLRRNRTIAAAFSLINIPFLLSAAGLPWSLQIGPVEFPDQVIGFFIAAVAITYVLVRRALAGWREGDRLRAEFDAAREVQEQLVAPAVDLPGFRIESAYVPAKQVGGDFFRVLPEADGGVLVVVGDVSGKGLKAAMTVSAIIGALRTMPELPPVRILGALNRGLVGQMGGGFATCCVARILRDGEVTIANAGHLSPYFAGAEAPVASGLPLGLSAAVEYEETRFLLAPGQPLTFVSDGVVEARNAAGELFGFERTLAISGTGAAAIARAATDFGQEDDITVLSLTLLPQEKEVAA
jgi:sigma-B regulation protein RsbU (phosphoserine phosphatase)